MYEYPLMTEENDYKELDSFWNWAEVKKIFLVCSNSVLKMQIGDYFDKLQKRMKISVIRFSDFFPNPSHDSVIKGIKKFCRENCDMIVAVGGGSAIDVAKCIRVYVNNENTFNNIKLLAIPTTAGTGSEATRFAVIYYQGEKQSIEDKWCFPSAVLLDPTTLRILPEYQRKSTMMDALCHALESFWSINSTKESRKYSEEAIRMILNYKDAYLRNKEEGNRGMLYAANVAGRAINIAKTTAGHAMCYKLTGIYGIAHGHGAALCVSRLWSYMSLHLDKCIDKRGKAYLKNCFEDLANVMGCSEICEAINKFNVILNELGLKAPQLQGDDELELLRTSVNQERLKNNPVLLEEKDIDLLYRQVFGV